MSFCCVAGDRASGDRGRASDHIHCAGGLIGGVAGDRASGDLRHASVSGNIDCAAVRLRGIVRKAAVCYRQRAVRPDAAAVLHRGIVLNQAAGHGDRSVVDDSAAAEGRCGIVFKRTPADRKHRSGGIEHRTGFLGFVSADRTAGDSQPAFVYDRSAAAGVVGSGDRAGMRAAHVGDRQRAVYGDDVAARHSGGQTAVDGMTVQVQRDLHAGRDGQGGILLAGGNALLQCNAASCIERRLEIGPGHNRRRSLGIGGQSHRGALQTDRLDIVDDRRFFVSVRLGLFGRLFRRKLGQSLRPGLAAGSAGIGDLALGLRGGGQGQFSLVPAVAQGVGVVGICVPAGAGIDGMALLRTGGLRRLGHGVAVLVVRLLRLSVLGQRRDRQQRGRHDARKQNCKKFPFHKAPPKIRMKRARPVRNDRCAGCIVRTGRFVLSVRLSDDTPIAHSVKSFTRITIARFNNNI